MGSWLIFQRLYTLKVDALGSTRPRLRVVELSNSVEAVTARSGRTAAQRKPVQPRAREKTSIETVPRSDTGAHAGERHGLSGTTDVREFGNLVP